MPMTSTGVRMRAVFAGLVGFLAIGLGACQTPAPEEIAPVQVSSLPYQRMDCRALTTRIAEMDQGLADLYARQRKAEVNDLYKTIFFLHPRATIVGPDLTPVIALAKGERLAANAALSGRC